MTQTYMFKHCPNRRPTCTYSSIVLIVALQLMGIIVELIYFVDSKVIRNDHIMVTAPLPVNSAKLSIIGPGQYYGGGPRWNPGRCSFVLLLLLTPKR